MLILLTLLLSTCASASPQIGSTDESAVTRDMPRPSGDEALVMDKTATVLSSREKHRLAEKIQRFEASIDLQLLIASSVEEGHTPKEIVTSLLNSWNLGSQPRNPSLVRKPMGGMLVLPSWIRIELKLYSVTVWAIFSTKIGSTICCTHW